MANLVTFAKKLWKDATSGGTPITAAELNRMEGGINDCATQINRLGDSVSLTNYGKGLITGLSDGLSFDDTFTQVVKFGRIVFLEIMVTSSNEAAAWSTIATLGESVRPINNVIAVAHVRGSASSQLVSISTGGNIAMRETGLAEGNTLEMSVMFISAI